MLKKFFLAVLLMVVVPSLANAWTITAKIGSPSGSITWGTQTLTSGTAYFSVANTVSSTDVTVQPSPGYSVAQVVVDGVNVTQSGSNVYTINYANKNHTFTAYFTPVTYSVSLTQTSGGVITAQVVAPAVGAITQTGLSGLAAGTTVEIVASPNLGNVVTSIGSTTSQGNSTVYSGSSDIPVKYRFTVDKNISFSALYGILPTVSARVTASTSTTQTGGQVVLDASGSTTNDPPLTYVYSVITGDPSKVTLTPVTPGSTAAMTFQASAPGSYAIQVTATSVHGGSGVASTGTITVLTPGGYASQQCTSCHTNRDAVLVGNYLASPHAYAIQGISCASCHNQNGNLGHPYNTAPTDVCKSCHTSFPVTTPGHQSLVGTSVCATCHDPHATGTTLFTGVQAPHYSNVTSAGYPASYVSSRSVCANCHSSVNDSTALDAVRKSWAGSGHAATGDAAWSGLDFKTADGCVRCHTRTGFIAYSTAKITAAWGSAADKTKEVLACNGCHKPDFSLRVLAPYSSATAFRFRVDAANTVSVPYKNLDYGPSNLCVGCHGGTTNGEIIKKAFAFANFTASGRLVNHFMVGGGVMDNSIGYEFDDTPGGRTLDFNKQNTWHSGIGLPSAQYDTGTFGPCVACHMATPGNEHSFSSVFRNTTGSITAVSAAAVCAKCHPSALGGGEQMTAQALNQRKSDFAAALEALRQELKVKGFDPDNAGSVTSWGNSAVARANNMGAVYNYVLLKKNDVAAYVHNPTYARRLILYSIDWIDNGLFDDSGYTSINMLNLPQGTKDQAISYLGVSPSGTAPNCFSCHQAYYN